MATANDKLIENLEHQLERLVEQLKDLEDCRKEIPLDEYELMRDETVEQIKEFGETLDRLQRGETSLNHKFSVMKTAIRKAISSSFNTEEMIKLFGDQSINELQRSLQQLEEDYRLKKVNYEVYEKQKFNILEQLENEGRQISEDDKYFMEKVKNIDMERLEQLPSA